MTLLVIAIAGGVGAPARYLLDAWVRTLHRRRFPWGTLVVNVTGSFALGVVSGLTFHGSAGRLVSSTLGVGLIGAFTTFSTFSYETIRLVEHNMWRSATANVVGSVASGLLAAGAGMALARAL